MALHPIEKTKTNCFHQGVKILAEINTIHDIPILKFTLRTIDSYSRFFLP